MKPHFNAVPAFFLTALLLIPAQTQAQHLRSRNPEHFSAGTFSSNVSATWLGGNGNWSNGALWSTAPAYPNNGNGITYDATITGGIVTLDRNITTETLHLSGGIVNGFFNLRLNEGLTWTGGGLSSTGLINLAAGSVSSISGAVSFSGPTLNNGGTVYQDTSITNDAGVLGTINNLAGATWNLQGGIPSAVTFNNGGNFVAVNAGVGGPFNNSGNVTINGSLLIGGGGRASGAFNVPAQATLTFINPPTYTFTTGATITGSGSVNVDGPIDVVGNTTIDPPVSDDGGRVTVAANVTLTLKGGFNQLDAGTTLEGGTIDSPNNSLSFETDAGLGGFGTVNADVIFTEAGLVLATTGTLTINGSVSFGALTYLQMSIGGTKQADGYSYLSVSGVIGFGQSGDSLLDLDITNNFESQLKSTDTFTVAHADGGISGTLLAATPNGFLNLPNGQRTISTDGKASFQVNYGDGSPYGTGNLVLSKAIVYPTPPPLPGLTFAANAGIVLPPFVANNGNVSQNAQTTNPSLGGRASYLFIAQDPGDYIVSALVNAPDGGHNSFFIDIDAEPTDPTMIWDIVSFTNGLESRTVCWRGTGTFDNPQIAPKEFGLKAGVHELVIRGREANTILGTITITPQYVLKIVDYTKNADGSVSLSWTGKTGKTYYVQRAPNPSFVNAVSTSSAISGSEPECHFTDPSSNLVGVTKAFYRILY